MYAQGTRVLMVRAVDAHGAGIDGVEITWQATVAGDVVTPVVDTTDATGLSSVVLRVGEASGLHGAVATAPSLVSRSLLVHVLSPIASFELGPDNISLISRQTAQLVVRAADAAGNETPIPVRFGSSDDRVATADTLGVVRARRAGRATIYANAVIPPFSIDSVTIFVREATPAQLQITPAATTIAVGQLSRLRAMALDSSGRAIDAELITWALESPHARIVHRGTFADSTVVHISGELAGSTAVTAGIAALDQHAPIDVVVDKLVQRYGASLSPCSGGISFGPSGQWYYIERLPGSGPPYLAVVRPGRSELSTWERSIEFGDCTNGFGKLPRPTISVDANESLYVPTGDGLLSIAGSNGQTRWFAPIGALEGNVAVSSTGLLVAVTDTQAIGLDSRDGRVVWRSSLPLVDRTASAIIDESRSVAYITGRFVLSAVDLQTGKPKWELPSADTIGGVAMARSGTLYVGAAGKVYAVLPDGRIIFEQRFGGTTVSGSPVIDASGNVYAATNNATLRAFASDLTPLWSYTHHSWVRDGMDSAIIDRAGIVYAGSGANSMAVKDGNLLWADEPQTGGRGYYWVLGPDGDLYAPGVNGVYRLRTNGADPEAQWPMTHGTFGRSGRAGQ